RSKALSTSNPRTKRDCHCEQWPSEHNACHNRIALHCDMTRKYSSDCPRVQEIVSVYNSKGISPEKFCLGFRNTIFITFLARFLARFDGSPLANVVGEGEYTFHAFRTRLQWPILVFRSFKSDVARQSKGYSGDVDPYGNEK